jgi:16S rRNA (uracil1498-N3)-methyltransferase
MMKHNRLSRIFVEANIIAGEEIELCEAHSHYLTNVKRLKVGDNIIIFNGIDGEWLAEITEFSKKKTVIKASNIIRKQITEKGPIIIFSLIKTHRLQFLIEKSCELGASKIIPIITKHCTIEKFNHEKAKIWAIEAAEQSMRLSVPQITAPIHLKELLNNWNNQVKIIFGNETEKTQNLFDTLISLKDQEQIAILIGPEGGFSKEEIDLLSNIEFIKSTTLGPRILRAETAAIYTLSAAQTFFNQ